VAANLILAEWLRALSRNASSSAKDANPAQRSAYLWGRLATIDVCKVDRDGACRAGALATLEPSWHILETGVASASAARAESSEEGGSIRRKSAQVF
jgi:hypothetical protein